METVPCWDDFDFVVVVVGARVEHDDAYCKLDATGAAASADDVSET